MVVFTYAWNVCVMDRHLELFGLLILITTKLTRGDRLSKTDLLSNNYLSVWGKYKSSSYWFQQNQTSLKEDRVALQCAADSFEQPQLFENRPLYLNAFSADKFSFLYGTLEVLAEAPIDGSTAAQIVLRSMRCANWSCPVERQIGFAFSPIISTAVMCRNLYSDPVTNEQFVDDRWYALPSGNRTIQEENYHTRHHYQLIWSQKFVACLIDGRVIANFTNHLALLREKHYVDISVMCSPTASNITGSAANTFILSNISYEKLPGQSSLQKHMEGNHSVSATWTERWGNFSQTFRLFAYDDDVAVYFDEIPGKIIDGDFYPDAQCIFDYVGDACRYVKQHYGPLQIKNDSRFYTLFHADKHDSCRLADQMDPSHEYRNVMSCGTTNTRVGWKCSEFRRRIDAAVKNYTTWALGYFSANCAKSVYGNPMFPLDKSALSDLIQYDILSGRSETHLASILLFPKLSISHPGPRNHTYWLRDWYSPLYERYGRTTVLRRYFTILAKNFPFEKDKSGGLRYTRSFRNMGEFVHFWSGAANVSLRGLAAKAFGWTIQEESNFQRAQNDFPNIRYTPDVDFTFSALLNQPDIEAIGEREKIMDPLTTASIVVVPVLIIGLAVSGCYWKRRKSKKEAARNQRDMANSNYQMDVHLNVALHSPSPSRNSVKYWGLKFEDDVRLFLLPKHKLEQSKVVLGSGEFGTVYAGTANGLYGISKRISVAVKVMKSRLVRDEEASKQLFQQEVNIMIKVGQHLNIVNLLGIILDDYPALLLELCDMGSLLTCLKDCRIKPGKFVNLLDDDENLAAFGKKDLCQVNLSTRESEKRLIYHERSHSETNFTTFDLISWAYQISRGLEYLSGKQIVHKDIAARNILLAKNKVAKVSDFGLAQWNEHNYQLLHATNETTKLPVRWMAPEAIISLSFNQETDVWSYGIVLWEIFSLGLVPYSHIQIAGGEVQFAQWLKAGNCLDKPQYSPNNAYNIMKECWTIDVVRRPSFCDLRTKFEMILSNEVAEYYTQMDQPYRKFNTENSRLLIGESSISHNLQ